MGRRSDFGALKNTV